MKRGIDREPQSSLREILCVLQKNIQQNLKLKKSGFFYLHEFLSSTCLILSVYVWLYGYMVAETNLKEGKKRIIIERTQRVQVGRVKELRVLEFVNF